MLTTMRSKLGPAAVTLIIGGIAATFVLSDFIAPRAGRGMRMGAGGSQAGEVNGEAISIAEFNRELSRRIESMKQMTGGKLSEEQIRMFKVREGVFNELVQRKLILQDCQKQGIVPSDSEVRKKIQELPYFQKDGRFDMAAYKTVLANNRLTPGGFEDMIRDDLTLQQWMESVKGSIQVAEDEVEREFKISGEKRTIKYVLLDTETGRKAVTVPAAEVEAFIKDPAKLARAKVRFEQVKSTTYKGKKFEDVQKEIARDVLAGEKTEEIRKANQKLADSLLPVLGKGSDAQANALLKSVGATVKSTGMITRQSPFIQGLGEAKELLADAFAEKSPIIPSQGGKAKKYESMAWVAVAVVSDSQKADMSKFAAEKAKLEQQIRFKKERVLQDEWIQQLRTKAKVEMNPDVAGDSGDSA